MEHSINIAEKIYPKEIPLHNNDPDHSHDIFLDLDISVHNDCFIIKIYHKIDDFNFEVVNFPFPDSNISNKVGYNTFLSQVIRFGRVSNRFTDFAFCVKFTYNKLKLRGFEEKSLKTFFNNFCCRHPEIVLKFGFSDFNTFWNSCIA